MSHRVLDEPQFLQFCAFLSFTILFTVKFSATFQMLFVKDLHLDLLYGIVRFYCIIPPIPTAKQLHFSTQQTYEVLMTTHSRTKSVENVLKKRPLEGSWVHFCQQWWWEMYIKWSVANKSVHGCLSSLLTRCYRAFLTRHSKTRREPKFVTG